MGLMLPLLCCKGACGTLTTRPANNVVVSGSLANLYCYSNNYGTNINWRYSNNVIVVNCIVQSGYTSYYSTHIHSTNCHLQIGNIDETRAGLYECYENAMSGESAYSYVTVLGKRNVI